MGTGAQAVWRYSVDCVHNFGASRDAVGAFCWGFFYKRTDFSAVACAYSLRFSPTYVVLIPFGAISYC